MPISRLSDDALALIFEAGSCRDPVVGNYYTRKMWMTSPSHLLFLSPSFPSHLFNEMSPGPEPILMDHDKIHPLATMGSLSYVCAKIKVLLSGYLLYVWRGKSYRLRTIHSLASALLPSNCYLVSLRILYTTTFEERHRSTPLVFQNRN